MVVIWLLLNLGINKGKFRETSLFFSPIIDRWENANLSKESQKTLHEYPKQPTFS
jgi:hypothetical protein